MKNKKTEAKSSEPKKPKNKKKVPHYISLGLLVLVTLVCAVAISYAFDEYDSSFNYSVPFFPVIAHPLVLNKKLYDEKLAYIARPLWLNIQMEEATGSVTTAANTNISTIATSTKKITTTTVKIATSTPSLWPIKTVYPNYGALLPFDRIVAYYGNFYTGQLGVLGQYPPEQMLQMLMGEVAKWQATDPKTQVIPAIDYIAVTAQGTPGPDSKYRLRMPDDQIQKAITLANQVNGLVILDIQVGQSTVETEVPLLAQYLKLPNVELALDPEFSMKPGQRPGTVIGSMDASDINFAAHFMANLVTENNIPPKILVVHRFTEQMVTNDQDITPLPQVQVVMDMDGFGTPAQKTKIYKEVVADHPVQFTGLKLFYKNDIVSPSPGLMTDSSVLNLTPEPSFIQYQ